MSRRPRVLIVEARFYDSFQDNLLEGARAALDAFDIDHETVTVPGALEIPAAIALAEKHADFDAYVALGCVIRGETHHFEIVANECARGLTQLAIEKRCLIGNGVLTVETEEQARVRADPAQGDKGGAAAKACLALLSLRETFKERGEGAQ